MLGRVEYVDQAGQLYPGELGPVIVVVIDCQRRLPPPTQPAHARQLGVSTALRLIIDDGPGCAAMGTKVTGSTRG